MQLYPLPGDGHREWHLYDAEGQLQAVLRVPAEFRLAHIACRIADVWVDTLGVETVRVYQRE